MQHTIHANSEAFQQGQINGGSTTNLWLVRIEGTDQLPADHDTGEQKAHEPNDYDYAPAVVRSKHGRRN